MNHRTLQFLLNGFMLLVFNGLLVFDGKAQCDAFQADFMFEYLSSDTLLLFNNSDEHTTHEWSVNGGEVIVDNGNTAFVLVHGDTTTVCLTVWNSDGCQAKSCKDLFEGHSGAMCQNTDCIWPGDTNGDGKANHLDLLNLGLGFGTAGMPRSHFPNPNDSIFWAPSFNDDWQERVAGVDLKHVDCDGNGFIDERDLLAIHKNYTPDIPKRGLVYREGAPIRMSLAPRVIFENNEPVKVEFRLNVSVGTNTIRVNDLHGLAFRVNLDNEVLRVAEVHASITARTVLGRKDNLLNVAYEEQGPNGVQFYDFALSRKNTVGVDTNGTIAALNIISADIVEFLNTPSKPFKVSISNLTMVNSKGEEVPFTLDQDTACVFFADNILTSNNDLLPLDQSISISPNPVLNTTYINAKGDLNITQYQIINETGQLIRQEQVEGQRIRLNMDGMRSGFYMIRVFTDRGALTKKVIVK